MSIPPEQQPGNEGAATEAPDDGYPLKETANYLDERLGLYLSEDQKRGFAIGLLVGTAIAGALITWSLGGMLRRSERR